MRGTLMRVDGAVVDQLGVKVRPVAVLNMSDEGFRKTPENGFEVSTPVSHDALISFYREQGGREAG